MAGGPPSTTVGVAGSASTDIDLASPGRGAFVSPEMFAQSVAAAAVAGMRVGNVMAGGVAAAPPTASVPAPSPAPTTMENVNIRTRDWFGFLGSLVAAAVLVIGGGVWMYEELEHRVDAQDANVTGIERDLRAQIATLNTNVASLAAKQADMEHHKH